MSLPITKLVQKGGSKKSCSCAKKCGCGKAPAKMWGAAKTAYGEKNSPAKMCYGKKK